MAPAAFVARALFQRFSPILRAPTTSAAPWARESCAPQLFSSRGICSAAPVLAPHNPDPQRIAESPAPKRARTAYNFFAGENINRLRHEHPEMSYQMVLKLCGEVWRALADADKARTAPLSSSAATMLEHTSLCEENGSASCSSEILIPVFVTTQPRHCPPADDSGRRLHSKQRLTRQVTVHAWARECSPLCLSLCDSRQRFMIWPSCRRAAAILACFLQDKERAKADQKDFEDRFLQSPDIAAPGAGRGYGAPSAARIGPSCFAPAAASRRRRQLPIWRWHAACCGDPLSFNLQRRNLALDLLSARCHLACRPHMWRRWWCRRRPGG